MKENGYVYNKADGTIDLLNDGKLNEVSLTVLNFTKYAEQLCLIHKILRFCFSRSYVLLYVIVENLSYNMLCPSISS